MLTSSRLPGGTCSICTRTAAGREFSGRDIALPATIVTFRIQTGDAETVEGTEHGSTPVGADANSVASSRAGCGYSVSDRG